MFKKFKNFNYGTKILILIPISVLWYVGVIYGIFLIIKNIFTLGGTR